MLTTRVIAKRTRPEAISALTASPEDSGKSSAMLAAIVEGFAWLIRLKVTIAGDREDDRHRHRLAERAAEAEHRAADDRRLAERQDGHPDHLPAGRAERQRALLEPARRLREDLAGDRGDDRQDHHRQHEPGDEHRAAGGRGGALEERDEAEVVLQPLHAPAPTRRAEDEDAPEAVDDARDRGQQVDDVAERQSEPARRDVADEERHRDRERHRDDDRDRRRQDRAEGERRDVVDEALAVGQVRGVGGDRRAAPRRQEDRDPGEQWRGSSPPAAVAGRRRSGRRPAAPAGARAARSCPALVVVSTLRLHAR